MRPLLALALLAALVACGSPCQDLGDRICACRPPGVLRDQCTNAVQTQLGSGVQTPGKADEAYCQKLLGTCPDPGSDRGMCDRLATEQGKIDCGLAYPPP
jgi:hypothetical protein